MDGACAPGPICGNSLLEPNEECDDGDAASGDGCSADCSIELLQLAAGDGFTCALLHDRVKCWGSNHWGQLGLGDTNSRGYMPGQMGDSLPYVDLGDAVAAVQISANGAQACARSGDGLVKCWGRNTYGGLGSGNTQDIGDEPDEMGADLDPLELGPDYWATDVGVGDGHACAVLVGPDTVVKCWGRGDSGQLGQGDPFTRGDQPNEMGDELPPIDLYEYGMPSPLRVRAGAAHTCAVLNNGTVRCWGISNRGQIGLGDLASRGDGPGEMGAALPMVDFAYQIIADVWTNADANCALLSQGSLRCWGGGDSGVLGTGNVAHIGDAPGEMGAALQNLDLGGGEIVDVSVGQRHVCAAFEDGGVKCWGEGTQGQLGSEGTDSVGDEPGELGNALAAIDLGDDGGAVHVACGGSHTCAVLANGNAKCWGAAPGYGDYELRGNEPGEMGDALPYLDL